MSGENILQKQDFFESVHPNQKSKNFKQEPILFEEIISEEKTQKNQIPFTQNFLSLKYDGLRIS